MERSGPKIDRQARVVGLMMGVIVGLAVALRAYGLYWGLPYVWHCDENTVYGVALRLGRRILETGSLDPHFSAYGALPLYLLLPAIWWLPLASGLDPAMATAIAGRSLALAFDVGATILVYVIGRRAHSRGGGIVAAAFYAVTLLCVREAHFYTVDVPANALALLYLLACMRAAASGAVRSFLFCGLALGLALSVKQSSAPLLPLGLIAWGVVLHRDMLAGVNAPNCDSRRAARWTLGILWGAFLAAAGSAIAWVGLRAPILEMARASAGQVLTADRIAQHEPIFFERHLLSIYGGSMDFLRLASVAAFMVAVGATWLAQSRLGQSVYGAVYRHRRQLWVFMGTAGAVFLALNPYAILNPKEYWAPSGPHSVTWNMLQVAGKLDPPPGWTLQFVGTQPFLYQVTHVLPYGMGLPLMLLGMAGLIAWTYRLLRRRDARRKPAPSITGGMCLVICAALLLGATMGGTWMKMARYSLPLMPFAALLGATWCVDLARRGGWMRWVGASMIGIGFASGLIWTVAYLQVYARPDNRSAALAYLETNAPPGSALLVEDDETWGAVGLAALEALPDTRLHVLDSYRIELDYFGRSLPEELREAKQQYLDALVAEADYVLLTDARIRRIATRSDSFPVLSRFYESMFASEGAWRLEASFTNGPALFGRKCDDSGAEITFSLFDHPKVYLFRRSPEQERTPRERASR